MTITELSCYYMILIRCHQVNAAVKFSHEGGGPKIQAVPPVARAVSPVYWE